MALRLSTDQVLDQLSDSEDSSESDIDPGVLTTDESDSAESEEEDSAEEEQPHGDGRGQAQEKTTWSDTLKDPDITAFTEPTGPLHDLAPDANPIDYFHLFIPPDMFQVMADQTNLYAQQCQAKNGKTDKYWKPVTIDDIRKYLYMNIMFGVHWMPDYRLYWNKDNLLRVSAFADVFGRQRFEKIHQYFHLSDNSSMPARGEDGFDPLYKIRPLLDIVRNACSAVYKPNREISVDEAMIKYKGRVGFRQFMPAKPIKYGIKVWCCAEAGTGYMLNFRFYTGKLNEPMREGLGHHVVLNTAANYLDKSHFIFFDNYFSSLKLAEDCLARNTYTCATTRTNRKGWPFKKKKMKKGECNMKLSSTNVLAIEWEDKKRVNILSTLSKTTTKEVTRRAKGGNVQVQIPTAVLDYNQFMNGVDLADQHRSYYEVGRTGKKWWRYGVWFLVQIGIINSFLLYRHANPGARRGDIAKQHLWFRIALMRNLLAGTAPRPSTSIQQSPSVHGRVTPSGEHKLVRLPGRKKCCFQCSKMKKKTESGRGVETVYGCLQCGIHICKGHCFTDYHDH